MTTARDVEKDMPLTQQVSETEKQYRLQNYARYPILLVRGKGP